MSWWYSLRRFVLAFLTTRLARWAAFFQQQLDSSAGPFAPGQSPLPPSPVDWFQRASPTPPLHWVERVRRDAPQLLRPGPNGLVIETGAPKARAGQVRTAVGAGHDRPLRGHPLPSSSPSSTNTVAPKRADVPDMHSTQGTRRVLPPYLPDTPPRADPVDPVSVRSAKRRAVGITEVSPTASTAVGTPPLPVEHERSAPRRIPIRVTETPARAAPAVRTQREYLKLPSPIPPPLDTPLTAIKAQPKAEPSPNLDPGPNRPGQTNLTIITEDNRWPDLPDDPAEPDEAGRSDAALRTWERRRRLDDEQQGLL